MTLGQMRERVSIQEDSATVDTFGQSVANWVDRASNVLASVEDLGGAETYRAGKVQTGKAYRLTIRYLPWLTANHRLVWGERTLEIDSVRNPDNRRRFHEILCREAAS